MAIRVVISDALGKSKILQLTQYDLVEWTNVYNKAGWFSLTLKREDYPRGLFAVDRRVDIYRSPRGRAERLSFSGYMRVYNEYNEDYSYTEDYSEELTVVYYGGAGQEAMRTFDVGATNAERLRASPINRREGFWQDTNEDDVGILSDGAAGLLYDNRPAVDFNPTNIELDYIYQADWALGDRLRITTGEPNFITISGPDFTDLLARRIIAYRAASAQANKDAEADDMMKEYVDENLVNATDADRNLDAGVGFEIAADQTAGPVVTHSAKFGNLLSVLQQVSDAAAEAGTRVYFAVVPVLRSGTIVPRFETRIGQWGDDRTYLKIGQGTRVGELVVKGVHVTATPSAETVTPIYEDDND